MRIPRQKKPDADYVRRTYQQLQELWQPTHLHWEYVDSLINDTVDLWPNVPSADEKKALGTYHSGKARNILDTAAAVFLASDPHVHREPTGDGEQADADASNAEKWGAALLNSTNRKQMESPDQAGRKYIVAYNYVVKKQPTLDEGAEEQLSALVEPGKAKRIFNPIVVTCPHPRSVLMSPTQKFPKEAVAILRLTGDDLAALAEANHGKYDGDPNGNPYEEQVCYEYYSKDWHALVLEMGEAVFVRRNPLGYQPFDHAFGPGGMMTGDMHDSAWLRYKCVGILEPALSLLVMLDQVLNAEQFYFLQASFLKVAAGGGLDPTEVAEQLRNRIMSIDPDLLKYVVPPNLPDSIRQIREHIEQLIEEVTFPRILAGFHEPGVTTLGENAIMHTSAARRFQGYLQALEFLASQTVSKAYRLAMQWQQPITIDGVTLKPETLDGDDNAEVKFPYLDAVLELQKGQDAREEYGAGLIDEETYHKIKGREDIQTIFMGKYKDLVRRHPATVERGVGIAAEQMGMDEIIRDWDRRAAATQRGGLVDPRGNPIGGGQPAPQRQPITPDVAKPPQTGMDEVAAMAGGMNE